MSYIETHELKHSTIQSIYADWDLIVKDPPYQRNGDIWPLEKRQLLIDSIINRYDIPKLYFHRFSRDKARQTGRAYAVIDGRQRLETIVKFMEGKFSLGKYFLYLEDPLVKAAEMTYEDLAKHYPKIKSRFDAFTLPIVLVRRMICSTSRRCFLGSTRQCRSMLLKSGVQSAATLSGP